MEEIFCMLESSNRQVTILWSVKKFRRFQHSSKTLKIEAISHPASPKRNNESLRVSIKDGSSFGECKEKIENLDNTGNANEKNLEIKRIQESNY